MKKKYKIRITADTKDYSEDDYDIFIRTYIVEECDPGTAALTAGDIIC